MGGEWSPPVSVTLPQCELPPSPVKPSSAAVNASSAGASMYHRFLRTVSSLRNDTSTFESCQVDDDIIPDKWVSDEEEDSDAEEGNNKDHCAAPAPTPAPPPRMPFTKSNSFRDLEVKWHQLIPPSSHLGNGGRYVHSVYSQHDEKSPVIGYVTSARKVQAKLRKGEPAVTLF